MVYIYTSDPTTIRFSLSRRLYLSGLFLTITNQNENKPTRNRSNELLLDLGERVGECLVVEPWL